MKLQKAQKEEQKKQEMSLKKMQKAYENKIEDNRILNMELVDEKDLSYEITIDDQKDIWALFQMTPYFWKTPKKGSEHLKTLSSLTTDVEFHIEIYRKKACE